MTIYIISIYPPPSTLSRRITTFLVGYTVNVNLYLPLESWMGVVDPILYTAIFYCRNHGFANALEAFVQDRPGSTKTKNCLTKLHVSSPTKIKRKISLVFFFSRGTFQNGRNLSHFFFYRCNTSKMKPLPGFLSWKKIGKIQNCCFLFVPNSPISDLWE